MKSPTKSLTDLQYRILATLTNSGPMTDERLIRLPRFRRYAPSTVRTRRAELTGTHRTNALITEVETRRNKRGRIVSVWGPTVRGARIVEV